MKIHIIQKGESLTTIAEHYEVDQEAIVRHNPQISNPDIIIPGMKLRIPQQSKKPTHYTEKKSKKKRTEEQIVQHQKRRPINEMMHDDGYKEFNPQTGVRMFHPASRPFTSTKFQQRPAAFERGMHKNEDFNENKIIYCDCCNRPMSIK